MKKIFNLNGWQRIFICIAVLWSVLLLSIFPYETEINKSSLVTEQLIKNANKDRPMLDLTGIDLSKEEWGIGSAPKTYEDKLYKLSNGTKLWISSVYKLDEVERAYVEILPIINEKIKAQFWSDIRDYLGLFALPLCALYIFGSMISWIRKGFISD